MTPQRGRLGSDRIGSDRRDRHVVNRFWTLNVSNVEPSPSEAKQWKGP